MPPKRRGAAAAAPKTDEPVVADLIPSSSKPAVVGVVAVPEEPVKVNNASLSEIKNACDDAIRRMLARPDQFKRQHLHTDVRLALGWASVLIAGATGAYGWYVDFEKSKPGVFAGVLLYVLLSVIQQLYAWFVEGHIIFIGKRKTVAGRIETERITVISRLQADPPTSPRYALTLTYVRSANGGKTLIRRGKEKAEGRVESWFDAEGNMDVVGFETWVGTLVGQIMGAQE